MALVGEKNLRLSTLLTDFNKGATLTRMLSLLYSVIFFIQIYSLKSDKKMRMTKQFHVKNTLLQFQ